MTAQELRNTKDYKDAVAKIEGYTKGFTFTLDSVFDISDGGAVMLVFFQSPTEDEIEQFSKNFEIRFIEMYGVIMITAKIGSLDWMDAPYSPHLSKSLTDLTDPKDGEGLSLTLMLIYTDTGEIKHLRLLSFSTYFSKRLLKTARMQMEKSFNKSEYDRNIARIYSSYPTSQIVKMSKDYCKFERKE